MSKIILIGSPNSGKSLLFNRLTGLSQKVANFPGITVDVATGKLSAVPELTLVDFPGTYSLQPISGEERVATEYFQLGLEDPERQAAKTPWWLLLLRCLALAAVIIGFAGPVLNPSTRLMPVGSGPVLPPDLPTSCSTFERSR